MKAADNRRTVFPLQTLSVCLALVLLFAGACNLFHKTEIPPSSKPLLHQTERPADSAGLEVFVIHGTAQQQELIRQLWKETDEQRIEPALRRRLMDNGFRIGFLGDVLPLPLSQLINVVGRNPDKPANGEPQKQFGDLEEVSITDLPRQPQATRQYRNLMPNMQAHLKLFDEPLPEFSFLEWEQNCLSGKTYCDAFGLICLSCAVEKGGTVRLTMMPELEYGVPEQKTVIRQGIYMVENGKPRRKFPHLAVVQTMLPGQWLIIGPVSEYNTGAGQAFFFRGSENSNQRLLAVRIMNVKQGTAAAEGTMQVPVVKTALLPIP
ncbi:MAG: hypothetical protein LBN39_12515 [Planctomycetaceae bacterium]|jgi:hypothetical protein|nr:hypothetical protein [Planctomycetaceae bacterium]